MITYLVCNESRHIVIANVAENVVNGFKYMLQTFRVFAGFSHKLRFYRDWQFLAHSQPVLPR